MSKHNPVFQKPNNPAPTDPIKLAQSLSEAQSTEATEQESTVADPEKIQGIQDLAVTVSAIAPTVGTVESSIEETGNVQDTTVAKPVTENTAAIARANRNPQKPTTLVSRPMGASARETSPANSASSQQSVVTNDFQSMIASEKQKGTVHSIALIMFLETYVREMVPGKPVKATDVVKMQEALYDQLVDLIERAPTKEFKRLWNITIAFFKAYASAALGPRYYSRGAKEWKRDPQQYTTLTNLINLLEASASDISSVTSQVNVNAVMGKGFSEEGRGRVIAFYLK